MAMYKCPSQLIGIVKNSLHLDLVKYSSVKSVVFIESFECGVWIIESFECGVWIIAIFHESFNMGKHASAFICSYLYFLIFLIVPLSLLN